MPRAAMEVYLHARHDSDPALFSSTEPTSPATATKWAVAHGHNVYFLTVPELFDQLARDVQENRLSERLTKLRVPTLLILNKMGYMPLDRVAVSFLFQLVSKRYAKGSVIVTSNKSYREWGQVFGDEFAAAAVIDRLLHFSSTVNIRDESYRLNDKKKAGVFTMPAVKAADREVQVGNLKPALRPDRFSAGEFETGWN